MDRLEFFRIFARSDCDEDALGDKLGLGEDDTGGAGGAKVGFVGFAFVGIPKGFEVEGIDEEEEEDPEPEQGEGEPNPEPDDDPGESP